MSEIRYHDAMTEVVLRGLGFPEAPRWRDGCLWFSDMQQRAVFRLDPVSGDVSCVLEMPGVPSGLGWDAAGGLMAVSMWDGQLLRDGAPVDLTALAPPPWNDMAVDGYGRAYVGNTGFDFTKGEKPQPSVVALVDGSARIAADGVVCPNGMVVDGTTLIVAETYASRLTAFDIGADGSLSGRRVWASLGDARPDGIALDSAGGCWVACFGSPEVLRVVEGGAVTDRVVASQPAVACALDDTGEWLYLCTAPGGSTANLGLSAGRIERTRVPDRPRRDLGRLLPPQQ
jgi:sugar lactone lactonase YvrE